MKKKMELVCNDCYEKWENSPKECFYCGKMYTNKHGILRDDDPILQETKNPVIEAARGGNVNLGSDVAAIGSALKMLSTNTSKAKKEEEVNAWKLWEQRCKEKGIIS